jgi:hypothetical protein
MKTINECLILKTEECERMSNALGTILLNTINRDFDGDVIYKSGVLTNIAIALGKKKYDELVKLYLINKKEIKNE